MAARRLLLGALVAGLFASLCNARYLASEADAVSPADTACQKKMPYCASCNKNKCTQCQAGYKLPKCSTCDAGYGGACKSADKKKCRAATVKTWQCSKCSQGFISAGGAFKKANCTACDTGMTSDATNTNCIADVDECTSPDLNDCSGNATCTNTPGPGFSCSCKDGFSGDGKTCIENSELVDECATGKSNCSPDAACTDLVVGFSCKCKKGFAGDGVTCAPSNTTCNAQISWTCKAQPPSCRYYKAGSSNKVSVDNFCNASTTTAGVTLSSVKYTYTLSNGTVMAPYWNEVLCPDQGGSYSVDAVVKYKSPDGENCNETTTFAVASDAAPSDCSVPKPSWSCDATSCWIDTSKREVSMAAFKAMVAPYYGPIMGDSGYQESCQHKDTWDGDMATCKAGTDKEILKQWQVALVNYYRAMGGVVANTSRLASFDDATVLAALMMSATGKLSHGPTQNEFKCWTQRGAEAAGKSNLFLGVRGLPAIKGYMYDPGSNNVDVGHRYSILRPGLDWTSSGEVASQPNFSPAHALSIYAGPARRDAVGPAAQEPNREGGYIMWPPRGYVPASLVFPRWSFRVTGQDIDTKGFEVTVTKDGSPVTNVSRVDSGTWDKAQIVFEPHDDSVLAMANRRYQPSKDITFQVTIKNSSAVFMQYDVITFGVDGLAFGSSSNIGLQDAPPTGKRTAAPRGGAGWAGDIVEDGEVFLAPPPRAA